MAEKRILIIFCFFFWNQLLGSNCDPFQDSPLSERIANYQIQLKLDKELKAAHATQKLTWVNTSPESISELRMYMYLNAFKNEKSTFLKDGRFFFW